MSVVGGHVVGGINSPLRFPLVYSGDRGVLIGNFKKIFSGSKEMTLFIGSMVTFA